MRAADKLLQEQEQERMQENGVQAEPVIEINVTKPEPFIGCATTKYLTSNEIAAIINQLFKSVYADWFGCRVDVEPQTGYPSLSLYFNHLNRNEDDVVAFSPKADVSSRNDLSRRIANQRINSTEGRSSYMITQYGRDGLEKFVSPRFKNKNGKVSWEQIAADVNNGSGVGMNNTMIVSQLRGIDIASVFSVIFGKDDNGDEVEYTLEVKNSIPGGFMIAVTRINKSELDRTLRVAGITNTNSLGICI